LSAADRAWQAKNAYRYLNKEWVKISYKTVSGYTITFNEIGTEHSDIYLESVIYEGGTTTFIDIKPYEGWEMVGDPIVDGATVLSWDKDKGELVITKPTKNVTITTTVLEDIRANNFYGVW
jgi:hypothetical protein